MVVEWTPQTGCGCRGPRGSGLAIADRNMKADLVWERKGQLYVKRRAMSSRFLDLFLRVRYKRRSLRQDPRMTRENPPDSWHHAAMEPFEFARDVFSRDGFTLLVDG